jgi:hypothetical protein
MGLYDRMQAASRADTDPDTYRAARRDAAYGLGTRCARAEISRDCPYNHVWTDAGAYHRAAPLPVSPFTARALARALPASER